MKPWKLNFRSAQSRLEQKRVLTGKVGWSPGELVLFSVLFLQTHSLTYARNQPCWELVSSGSINTKITEGIVGMAYHILQVEYILMYDI